MANKSITMIQIRRILQLHDSGTSILYIAKTQNIHRKTITEYLYKLAATGKSTQELLKLDDQTLGAIVYSKENTPQTDARYEALSALFPYFIAELLKTGVTRKLLWQEYTATNSGGYGYTQFCEHFARYRMTNKATMHFTHTPGEYLQVDFAGKQLSYIDAQTGELISCPVLVCTLPFSNYTYVEALACASQEHLFAALNRCVEFMGGVPKNVLSDNMKQYVQKNNRYEFDFQSLAQQWSVHYNTNLDATRPRKPKDKPSVEKHVHISYLRIYAQLRKQEVFSLQELNASILKLLADFNNTDFQKLSGSRLQRFTQHEQAQLKTLPQEPFTVKYTTRAKVQMNYHVVLGENSHQYSVPYQYLGKQTTLVYDQNTVEVFIGTERIALHRRNTARNGYSTFDEHMPKNHLFYKTSRTWDADYFLSTATKIGPCAAEVTKEVLKSRDFVEQTYKACLGLKRLAETYGNLRFEAACKRALTGTWISYGVIKNILEKNLDKITDTQTTLFRIPYHDNTRGKEAYI